jgi:predicted permease
MKLRRFFCRRAYDRELAQELEVHLQHEVDDAVAGGMNKDEALRRARIKLGSESRIRDEVWEWNSLAFFETLLGDLRHAARTLTRSPGFAILTIAVMALGIGANAALFTVVRSVLLKPLPFRDPDRLVMLYERSVDPRFAFNVVAPGMFSEWRKQAQSFTQMALFGSGSYNLSGGQGQLPEKIESTRCSADFFSVLGVAAAYGRMFYAKDDRPQSDATVVLSWGLWKRRFGGDPSVVGTNVLMDGIPYAILGIAPSWFAYPDIETEAWTPIYHEVPPSAMTDLDNHEFNAIARLKPGVGLAQARSEIDTITHRMHEQNPDKPTISLGANIRLLLDDMVQDFKTPLYVLLAATGCLLLIVCTNVANLLIARAAARRREMAVRVALGGTRWRLIREQLSNVLVLAGIGGILGLILASVGVEWLLRVRHDIAREEAIGMDWVVIAATMGVTFASALLAGILPALPAGARRSMEALQESSRSFSAGQARTQLRRILLSAEVCLTVVLLIAAGLLLRSYQKLRSSDPGCATENVLTMRLSLPKATYPEPAHRTAFFAQLVARVRALPGVEAAGMTTAVPGQGYTSDNCFDIREHPPLPKGELQCALERSVTPGYFEALQIRLLRGRTFDRREELVPADSVIVSESFAKKYLPGEDPIGRHIEANVDKERSLEIVGVVGDTRYLISQPAQPMIYVPLSLGFRRNTVLVVRSSQNVSGLALPVQQVIQSLDRDLPVAYVLTMDQLIGASTVEAHFTSTLIVAFAALSLSLAAVGLYGVLSYLVTQRRNEIGVRMALGAQRKQVLALVLGDGLKPAWIGLTLGLLGGTVAARLIRSMLYGVHPLDAVVFLVVSVVLMVCCGVSCLIPAWQASRVDPMGALRVE